MTTKRIRKLARRPLARLAVLFGALAVAASGQMMFATNAAAFSQINGSGSTYVGLAMSDWQNGANSRGIPVNYSALGSPAGVNQYGDQTVDFAGTEAEISSLIAAGGGRATPAARAVEYLPDVPGAGAAMSHVTDAGGNKVPYRCGRGVAPARMLTDDITSWADPAITA